MPPVHRSPLTALVLSGGGPRGAYQAGVVAGLSEIVAEGPLFDIFVGTSVGAINVAFTAANAERPDLGASRLTDLWSELRIREMLHPSAFGALARLRANGAGRWHGPSLLDPRPIERIVTDQVPWQALHANVRDGRVAALIVAALHVSSGRTTMFAELAAKTRFVPSGDPRRVARFGPVGPDEVLASAAIPVLFPSRSIDGGHYYDGGLRFNTPIAPAIRCGAERLVVVSLLSAAPSCPHAATEPGPLFLAGKLLNALMLDPVAYDLAVLERFNRLIEALEATLPEAEMARVRDVIAETRGLPYRRIETLTFQPSMDVGRLAAAYLHEHLPGWVARRLVGSGDPCDGDEADWASYVLYDGAFARQLIELGKSVVRARADEVRAFFGA